jgi:hypothetical protein
MTTTRIANNAIIVSINAYKTLVQRENTAIEFFLNQISKATNEPRKMET